MRYQWAVLLFAIFVWLGCRHEPDGNDTKPESPSRGMHEEHNTKDFYEARGTVLWSEPGRIYLNHEAMPGFMDAMAMGFDVRDPAILVGLDPGSDVEFRVVVDADSFYIDQIHSVETPR